MKATVILIIGLVFTLAIMLPTMGVQYEMWQSANSTANIAQFTVMDETLDVVPFLWFGLPFVLFLFGLFWVWRSRRR